MIITVGRDAGRKLLVRLYVDRDIKKGLKKVVVVSLLRGGVVIGDVIAKGLFCKHLPLVVAKIPASFNPELAIGALCFDTVYLEKDVLRSVNINKAAIRNQIEIARKKFTSYLKRFNLKQYMYARNLKGKIVILVDDGIATGSTVKVAFLYLKSKRPRSIILAVPVAPNDFDTRGFDKTFILTKDRYFSAVSKFYERFPQIEDEEVVKTLNVKR